VQEILGESDDDDEEADDEDEDDDEEEEDEEGGQQQAANGGEMTLVQDMTEQDLVNLKRTIYLTIMSSAGFEEATHKLMKLDVKEPQYIEMCKMLIDCCSQEKTYLKYYGLIAMRFCMSNRSYQDCFEQVRV
jgi:pre-mRNA-splicing factor CWC22